MRSSTTAGAAEARDGASIPGTNGKRRRFLLALGAGGAGAAAAAVAATPAVIATPQGESPPQTRAAGYRETEHVRDYYRTARI